MCFKQWDARGMDQQTMKIGPLSASQPEPERPSSLIAMTA
jgi:hypothetical protein